MTTSTRAGTTAALLLFVLAGLAAQTPPRLRAEVFVSGLSAPLAFVQDPLDSTVQYVVEQGGRIRVVRNGLLESTDFLDLRGAISGGGERGLLGLAFPPGPAGASRCFVNFTNPQGHTVIARFRRAGTRADPASRFDLRWGNVRYIAQPYANHNGGHLAFGPDGYLYIGMGDGGASHDPQHRAQDPASRLGKFLRIDVGVGDADPVGHRIPPDNPFLDGSPVSALPEIWSFGLRNPWKFNFDDPALGGTGALLIGDVGQNAWEEVDYEPPNRGGRNYGWRNREGAHDNVTVAAPAYGPLTDPIHEYRHAPSASITGGYVYRGARLGPGARGRYFFGDFITGQVWSIALAVDPSTGEAAASGLVEHTADLGGAAVLGNVSSFGVDAAGELYVVSYSRGLVLELWPTAPSAPVNLRIIR